MLRILRRILSQFGQLFSEHFLQFLPDLRILERRRRLFQLLVQIHNRHRQRLFIQYPTAAAIPDDRLAFLVFGVPNIAYFYVKATVYASNFIR